eukprot:1415119-Rhodomonas_salina.2
MTDNWATKAQRRRTTGTGRCRYIKTLPRRFKVLQTAAALVFASFVFCEAVSIYSVLRACVLCWADHGHVRALALRISRSEISFLALISVTLRSQEDWNGFREGGVAKSQKKRAA